MPPSGPSVEPRRCRLEHRFTLQKTVVSRTSTSARGWGRYRRTVLPTRDKVRVTQRNSGCTALTWRRKRRRTVLISVPPHQLRRLLSMSPFVAARYGCSTRRSRNLESFLQPTATLYSGAALHHHGNGLHCYHVRVSRCVYKS